MERPSSARGAMTPRQGNVRELVENTLGSVANMSGLNTGSGGGKGGGIVAAAGGMGLPGQGPSAPPPFTAMSGLGNVPGLGLAPGGRGIIGNSIGPSGLSSSLPPPLAAWGEQPPCFEEPSVMLSNHVGTGFHFDPIATVVQVDFPSRIANSTVNPGPHSPHGAFTKQPDFPAGLPRNQKQQGLGLCGAVMKDCMKTTGLSPPGAGNDGFSQKPDQPPTPSHPGSQPRPPPPKVEGWGVNSLLFCCPESQMVLRGKQGDRQSIPAIG